MGSTIRCLVRRDTYRDSVELMRVAAELEQFPGVTRAALLMATPANRDLLAEAGLLVGEAVAAQSNDLVVAVAAAESASAEGALAQAEQLLIAQVAAPSGSVERPAPRTVAEALGDLPTANLAIGKAKSGFPNTPLGWTCHPFSPPQAM